MARIVDPHHFRCGHPKSEGNVAGGKCRMCRNARDKARRNANREAENAKERAYRRKVRARRPGSPEFLRSQLAAVAHQYQRALAALACIAENAEDEAIKGFANAALALHASDFTAPDS